MMSALGSYVHQMVTVCWWKRGHQCVLAKTSVWVSELAPSACQRAIACIFFVFQGLNICTGWVDQMTKCGGLMCCAAEQDDKWTSRLGDNRALFISITFKSEEETEWPTFVVKDGDSNFWCCFLNLEILYLKFISRVWLYEAVPFASHRNPVGILARAIHRC